MTMITESRATRLPLAEAGLLAAMASAFAAYRRDRRMLRELGAMDDHILRDIGLTYADVMQASTANSPMDGMGVLHRARSRHSA